MGIKNPPIDERMMTIDVNRDIRPVIPFKEKIVISSTAKAGIPIMAVFLLLIFCMRPVTDKTIKEIAVMN